MDIHNDQYFMNEVIEESRQGLSEGGIPIGSVLAKESKIIGRGHNRRVQENNPLAHDGEIVCLINAGRIGDHRTHLKTTKQQNRG